MALVERATRRRVWKLSRAIAVLALASHGLSRFIRIGGFGGRGGCAVFTDTTAVVPSGCWYSAGWLGWATRLAQGDSAGLQLGLLAVAATAVSLVLSGTERQRRITATWCAVTYLLGSIAVMWAFERNVSFYNGRSATLGLRIGAWAPFAVLGVVVVAMWVQSPFTRAADFVASLRNESLHRLDEVIPTRQPVPLVVPGPIGPTSAALPARSSQQITVIRAGDASPGSRVGPELVLVPMFTVDLSDDATATRDLRDTTARSRQ